MSSSANKIEEFFDKHAPFWDSYSSKNKDYLLDVLKGVDINFGDKVLDLGCGTGVITSLLYEKSQADLFAIDLSTEMIKIAESKIDNPNIHFSTTDFYCYHETDFDEIVIFDAYPHFIEIDKFKNSLLSSLKSGGRVYIIHDISRKELNKHHANHAAGVSRMIKDPVNEAKIYEDKFNIIKAEEGDDYYHLFMEKKYE